MIEIGIEDNSKEQVRFGGIVYDVDFSDAKQKEYSAAYEKGTKRLKDLSAEYDELRDDEKATGDDLAKKAVEIVEAQRDESINFLELVFGEGEGKRLYDKCGQSTEYLSQKVSELMTAISLKRQNDYRNEIKSIKDKYIHRRVNKR